MINFTSDFRSQKSKFKLIGKNILKRWIHSVVNERDRKVGEITCIFMDDKNILELNRSALNHNYYTDIITFDFSQDVPDGKIYADLYISIDTVLANSETYKQPYTNKLESELCRVIIHGILHLLGENDSSESEQKKMRNAENKSLELLRNDFATNSIRCSYQK